MYNPKLTRKIMKKIAYIGLVLSILSINIWAQAEEANCGIEAWVIDKDPNGLNVRSQPNANSKILTKLKRKNNDSDFITVYVTGYSNGWIKIARAENIDGDLLFDDIGWVSAKMIATGTKGNDGNYAKPVNLYTNANTKKKIGLIPSESEVQIVGFSCGWIKVNYKGKTGWIRDSNICGNPVTTCS